MAREVVVVSYDDMWAEMYEKAKIDASFKFRNSPGDYVDAKYDCIMKIMDKAKSYYKNEYNSYAK